MSINQIDLLTNTHVHKHTRSQSQCEEQFNPKPCDVQALRSSDP